MVTTGDGTNEEAQSAVSKLIKLLAGEELAGKERDCSEFCVSDLESNQTKEIAK